MTGALVYDNLCAFYGSSQILHGVSFQVDEGSVVCLLGLNGMGKTTTLRATMGLVDRIEGKIVLNGQELCGPTYRRSKMGVTLVPEDRKVFPGLTVEENLRVAQRKAARGDDFRIGDAIEIFLTRSRSFPVSANASSRKPARSAEASSRCWSSPAPCWRTRTT